ncbi:MAG TPA: hypothetical protein VG013_21370, partial [Gemmataceae bacterium]|nr:hypothetical protein [Gemmataceae bacterium]
MERGSYRLTCFRGARLHRARRPVVLRLVLRSRRDGDPQVYIGPADWMDRNLSRRVEVVFPVDQPDLNQRLVVSQAVDRRDCPPVHHEAELMPLAHHLSHIHRYAASNCRVKRLPSVKVDPLMRSR